MGVVPIISLIHGLVCVIDYIYPAASRPKDHGSSGRLFYIPVSCPQNGLAIHSRAPQLPIHGLVSRVMSASDELRVAPRLRVRLAWHLLTG